MELEDVIAAAEKETAKQKKIAYYVAFFIMGKIFIIMLLWFLYVIFIQRHVQNTVEQNTQDSYLVVPAQPTTSG